MVNLEGVPLDESITRPGVISETGCPKRGKERETGDSLVYTGTSKETRRPGRFARREERDPRHSLFDEDHKVHKTPQRRRHREDWLCALGLKKGLVPRGYLTDRTVLI